MISLKEYQTRSGILNNFIDSLNGIYNISIHDSTINPYLDYLKDHIESNSFTLNQFIIVLKSNSLLMMYNLVESTVRTCVKGIFSTISEESINFQELANEYRKIWYNQQYKDNKGHLRSKEQHMHIGLTTINEILEDSIEIRFQIEKYKISGNVDSKFLDNLITDFSLSPINNLTDSDIRASVDMIKNQRNALAHGNVSFIEAARNSTIDDIRQNYLNIDKILIDLINTSNDLLKKKSFLLK